MDYITIDTNRLLALSIQTLSFIAAFATIAAGILMSSVTKKFAKGFVANGFKTIGLGVFLLALGILIDTVNTYLQTSSITPSLYILIIKQLLLVLGTFIIVIGSKKTVDKLKSLTE